MTNYQITTLWSEVQGERFHVIRHGAESMGHGVKRDERDERSGETGGEGLRLEERFARGWRRNSAGS